MAISFTLSVQNVNNWSFWITKTNALVNLIEEQDDIDNIYYIQKI